MSSRKEKWLKAIVDISEDADRSQWLNAGEGTLVGLQFPTGVDTATVSFEGRKNSDDTAFVVNTIAVTVATGLVGIEPITGVQIPSQFRLVMDDGDEDGDLEIWCRVLEIIP